MAFLAASRGYWLAMCLNSRLARVQYDASRFGLYYVAKFVNRMWRNCYFWAYNTVILISLLESATLIIKEMMMMMMCNDLMCT